MIYDERSEKALLGALMQHENPGTYLLGLTEEDMVFEDDKIILAAMQRLFARREPFDLGVVGVEVGKDPRCTPSTAATAIQCVRMAPSTALTGSYYATVKDHSNRRKIQSIAQTMAERAQDMSTDAGTTIAETLEELRRISVGKDSWRELSVLVAETFEDIERLSRGDITYLPTGIADLDSAIGGLFPGEVTVLGARPAVGKSALAQFIGASLAERGKKVGICSLEMSPVQYLKRLIAAYADIDGKKLRTGRHISPEEWERIVDAVSKLAGWDMPFTFSVRTVEDLAAEARHRMDTKGLDLLIVDYMQLLHVKRPVESDFVRVSVVSHEIKQLALDLNIPILALAQVARPETKGNPKMPALDSLRGSGDIEQDADNVIFLHRPQETNDESINPHHVSMAAECINGGVNQYIVCNIAKQRNGTNRMFDMIFEPAKMRYRCLAH